MEKIIPRADLHFKGAKTGRKYHLETGKPVDIDIEDVAHLDPKDFARGEKPPEQPKGKKK